METILMNLFLESENAAESMATHSFKNNPFDLIISFGSVICSFVI